MPQLGCRRHGSLLGIAVLAVASLAPAGAGAADPATIHEPANRCLAIRAANGKFVARATDSYRASAASLTHATGFYFEPTGLGTYLLLESHQAVPGSVGAKALLGIADPAGALLDEAGELIETAGEHVSAVGDMANYFLDPVEPLGDEVRDAGETAGAEGDTVSGVAVDPSVAVLSAPSDLAVWNLVRDDASGSFQLVARAGALQLGMLSNTRLGLGEPGNDSDTTRFELIETVGCDAYPEATPGATVLAGREPARSWRDLGEDDDSVFGWVDAHAHVTASEFIGGRINYGAPFHEFGVEYALGDCEENHGPDGSTAHVHMVTSGGQVGSYDPTSFEQPNATHETRGWPDFPEWPSRSDLMHHQSYYVWLERAFLAGQKILVNLITHNEILCQIVPQKKNDCDGMANIRLQAATTYALQDYVDAQAGGPGKGWFRVVTSPAEARAVIADGKLAVVLGVEMSKVLNCGEFLDQPECTAEEIVERLDEITALGARVVFPVHKFDNAFGGHLPHTGFGIGTVLMAGNLAETGHPLEVEECPAEFSDDDREFQPSGLFNYLLWQFEYAADQSFPQPPSDYRQYDPRGYIDTEQCNIRGLTDLGSFLTEELIARKLIIDVDHMGRRAANDLIDITDAAGHPVISSHDWTGSSRLLDRVAASGGFLSRFAGGGRSSFVGRQLSMRDRIAGQHSTALAAGGVASDVNGIASLPSVPGGSQRISYPFTSYDGAVRFDRQVTGERSFGLYDGRGVAHYGLYADFIADAHQFGGPEAEEGLDAFFHSAEAYLQMWERVVGTR